MVTSNATIETIKRIIEKNYARLALAVLGKRNLPPNVSQQFPNEDGRPLLEQVYYHNYLNKEGDSGSPKDIDSMRAQQHPAAIPVGEAHTTTVDSLNSNLLQLIEKQRAEVTSRIVGFIRDNNNRYKNNALNDLERPEHIDSLMKESTLGELKTKLRDYSEDANRDWTRIVNTEVSNAIGAGSADAIVVKNRDKSSKDVYVFRINPDDSATCKYCREFYIDSDGSPKVYRLSTILSNGTNYGKKPVSWRPVAGATHPNCRDSQLIELRPGWKVLPGGGLTFIGLNQWEDYIYDKVQS